VSIQENNIPIEALLIGTAIHKIVLFSNNLDFDFKYINIDNAFEDILGVNKDEICKKSYIAFLSDFHADLASFYKDFVRDDEKISAEFFLNIFEKQIKVNLIKIDKEYIVTLLIDLKSYSQSIKNASKYETLLNNSMDIILTIKATGEIIDFNEQALKEYGYTREELLKLKIYDIRKSNAKNLTSEQLNIAVQNGIIFEALHSRKDGTIFPVEVRSVGSEIDGESIIFSIIRDITARKLLTDDLNKKNRELETALAQLRETQIQLMNEDKMASIGQLSAGIAHEINNPLGFVLSNFNTLKKYINKFSDTIEVYRKLKSKIASNPSSLFKQELDEFEEIDKKNKIDYILQDLEELFSDTEEGLDRIRKIVIALRNFAHENVSGEFEEYDLNEGIKNTLIIVKNEIKYNCEIKTNLASLPLINVIGSEINQVLLNTIINASHAMKEKIEKQHLNNGKYGEITITTYCEDDYVCYSIEDNGIGISKENINKVFEPFFTTKPTGVGTGLGLSISYEIIKNKHKGEINIESTQGLGAKVTIKLPQLLK
jgi:two-component system, NtrC family, sensor kinase